MKVNKTIKQIISLFFIFIFFISILIPTPTYAHDAAFLLVTIDEGQNLFQGDVIIDKVGEKKRKESKHAEAQLGNFTGFINGTANMDSNFDEENDGKEGLVFTFPSEMLDDDGPVNHATAADIDRAYYVRDTLVPSLNDALLMVNGWKNYRTTTELINTAKKLARHQDVNGWAINPIGYNEILKINPKFKINKDLKYLSLTSPKNPDEVYVLPFAIRKGYKGESDVMAGDRTYTKDVEWITWRMLVAQAIHAYKKGYTASNHYELIEPTTFELEAETFIEKQLNKIRSSLGLYDVNDLVFNAGTRGSKAFYYGAMPERWMNVIGKFYLIFMILALSLLALGLLTMIIDKSFKTMNSNPVIRVGVLEQMKRMIIAGILISVSFPLINLLFSLNQKIVDIFSSVAVAQNSLFGVGFSQSSFLGSLFLSIAHFLVPVYLNAVYVIRSLALGILIAGSPLFIATLVFGGNASETFYSWAKNLIENIFLQSYHAVILSVITTLQIGSRGFENVIISLSIIPLTKMFREIFFPMGNGLAHRAGLDVGNSVKKTGLRAFGAASVGAGWIKHRRDKGGRGGGYDDFGEGGGDDFDEIEQKEEEKQKAKNDSRVN